MKNKGRSAFKRLRNALDLVRQPDVVLVAKENPVPFAVTDCIDKVLNNSASLSLNIHNARILRHQRADYLFGLTAGLVIGNNYFIAGGKLRQNGAQLLLNIFFALIGGKCNGNHQVTPDPEL